MKTPTIRRQSENHFGAWGLSADVIDWTELAACRDTDPETFFPISRGESLKAQIEEAKAICNSCPVAADCLAEAIESGAEGIWGGHTEEERRPLRRAWLLQQQGVAPEPVSREEKIANRLCLKCGEQLPATASRDRRWCDNCQRKPAACGTPSGYFRHIKARTPTCGPCRDAANKQRRERERKRREAWLGGAA